jgi:hypothetical protein
VITLISNTFTRSQELEPYRSTTTNMRILEARGKWDNVHGVPGATLQRMAERWEPLPVHADSARAANAAAVMPFVEAARWPDQLLRTSGQRESRIDWLARLVSP